MIHLPSSVTVSLLLGMVLMEPGKIETLFSFGGNDAAKEWQAVNDGVMGGVSDGRFKVTDQKTLEFFGMLSLENNGGFASVRSRSKNLGLQPGDVLVAKIRGDGREYSLNLYLNRPLIAFSYRATVPKKKDEWLEVKVPLDQFEATSFGRVMRNAGPVKPTEVNSVGFMLSDKKPGSFKLEIESIAVERPAK